LAPLLDQTNTRTHRVGQLLNTFSNLGGTWPRYFVLKGVDYFSIATCKLNDAGKDITIKGMGQTLSSMTPLTCTPAQECVSEQGKSLCQSMNGQCETIQDGYYYVSAICITLGFLTLVFYIMPTARRLEGEPRSSASGLGESSTYLCSVACNQMAYRLCIVTYVARQLSYNLSGCLESPGAYTMLVVRFRKVESRDDFRAGPS